MTEPRTPGAGRPPPSALHPLLADGLVRPALEVVHGWRARRQIARLCSPPLNQVISSPLHGPGGRLPNVSSTPRLRWSASGSRRALSFSGTYRTVDGRTWPVSGEVRRRPSTGQPFLVALETAARRNIPIGPTPVMTRARPILPTPTSTRSR